MTDILDLIDNALSDYSTSCDAMRWAPEPSAGDTPTFIDAIGSMVNPAMTAWLRANLASDNIRLRYDTTPLVDASPTVAYSTSAWWTPMVDSEPHYGFRDEAAPFAWSTADARIITGYLEPALWAAALNGNAYIGDETLVWAAARRLRLRKVHSDYSRRLRARRKRR
jgi:hypothetical protein